MQDKPNKKSPPLASWLRLFILSLVVISPFLWSVKNTSSALAQSSPEKPGTTIYLPSIVLGGPQPSSKSPDWLVYLNSYRAMANLKPVNENLDWSAGGLAHALYTVKNDVLMHNEDEKNPWYSPEGKIAAQSGNLMGSYDHNASDRYAIDSWMQAPFHALGILDPSLGQVGYGSYREEDGGLQMSATLDVLRGLGNTTASAAYPVYWPGNGSTVPLRTFRSEYPDPLTGCSGYTTPSGLPIYFQLGPGNITPAVSAYSISTNGSALESCMFTEETYTNPDRTAQDTGRAILNERDAVVLIPRQPLNAGGVYTVSITANGQTYTWSFTVSSTAN